MKTTKLLRACVVAIASAAIGCSGDEEPTRTKAALAEGCVLNSDCAAPLVCAFRRCHQQCQASRDCPAGQRCVAAERPLHVCLLDDERECSYTSECPPDMVCAVDGKCRNQCAGDRDCLKEQKCVSGTCADPDELLPDGGLRPKAGVGGDSATGQPCSLNSDCPPTHVCRNGACAIECVGPLDCPAGQACVASRCVLAEGGAGGSAGKDAGADVSADGAGGGGGTSGASGAGGAAGGGAGSGGSGGAADGAVACQYNSQCQDAGQGWVCKGGVCMPECLGDVDCPAGKVCDPVLLSCKMFIPEGAVDGYGKGCTYTSQCPGPLVCGPGGTCGYECLKSLDCPVGTCCKAYQCVSASQCLAADASSDAPDADAAADACFPCKDNLGCDDKKFCNGVEWCFAGCCKPALDTPCNSHSGCIVDSCDEDKKTCDHITLAPQDGDGDGQLAVLCGGKDCDDGDKTVYVGASELCDGKDNDCNGKIDDGSRKAYGKTVGAKDEFTSQSGAGAPLGNGWVMFIARLLNGNWNNVHAWVTDANGTPQAEKVLPGVPGYSGYCTRLNDAAGEATSAAVVQETGDETTTCANFGRQVLVVDKSLNVLAAVILAPKTYAAGDADVVWTGSEYLVGWAHKQNPAAGNILGSLAAFQSNGGSAGGLSPLPTEDKTNLIGGRVRVASNATHRAAAYAAVLSGKVHILVMNPSLGVVAGPVLVGQVAQVFGLGGTKDGFIVAWSASGAANATFIGNDGKTGPTVTVASGIPLDGSGDSDGAGAMFALRYADGVRFGYARGALENGFEAGYALSATPSDPMNRANIAGFFDGTKWRHGIFYWHQPLLTVTGVAAGCP